MNKPLVVFSLLLSSVFVVNAQERTASQICSEAKIHNTQLAKPTVASLAEDDYDMQYVKFNLSMNNTSTSIVGDVTTTSKVVANTLSAYVFELNTQLTIDSLFINGQSMSVATNGIIRTVNLSTPLAQNALFTVKTYYHGAPTGGAGFSSVGISNQQSPSWGNTVTYTLSESYEAKDWWPTKQSLTDKIDSADIWITVLSNLKAGSNGLLKNITAMPNNKSRYEWKSTYPIDYYLLSVAIASYVDYSYYIHFPGTTDSLLCQNYVYDNPQTLSYFHAQIDSVGNMIQYLSTLYGTYPFMNEKYGHCMAPLNGGMEHQTMTTLGNFGTTLSVHELGHQWFGDNVTCGTWKDIWLNEGFAAYTEYLFVDHFRGATQGYQYMLTKHNNVLSQPAGSVYVDDTTNESRIFDSRLTYDKGASVLHTLRFVFNNDSLFFAALRTYQNTFHGKTAITEDLKNITAQVLGQNLDTFYNQWVYKQGYPIYNATWNQIGTTIIVHLNQTTSDASVALFYTPLELQFHNASGDTTVRVYNNQASQTFYFTWNKQASTIAIDPNDWILNTVTNISKDPTLLGVSNLITENFKVYPNPTHGSWNVTNLKAQTDLQLTDINGRVIWEGKANNEIIIPGNNLASGFYILKLKANNKTSTLKLIKQ